MRRQNQQKKKHTKVQSALILNVVVGERTTVFEPRGGEDQTLLVGGNALLLADLRLDVVDGVGRVHFQRERLPAERLDEDPPDATRTGEDLDGRPFPDAVVREEPAVAVAAAALDHLASENQNLLIGGEAVSILDLGFDAVDRV